MTLTDCIEAFRPIAAGRGWDTPLRAFQWCGDATEAFAGFVSSLAPEIECTEECFNGLPQAAIDAIRDFGHPWMIDEEGTGHVMNRSGDIFVDWTARQFYPPRCRLPEDMDTGGTERGGVAYRRLRHPLTTHAGYATRGRDLLRVGRAFSFLNYFREMG